jgi:hypothetical protein
VGGIAFTDQGPLAAGQASTSCTTHRPAECADGG